MHRFLAHQTPSLGLCCILAGNNVQISRFKRDSTLSEYRQPFFVRPMRWAQRAERSRRNRVGPAMRRPCECISRWGPYAALATPQWSTPNDDHMGTIENTSMQCSRHKEGVSMRNFRLITSTSNVLAQHHIALTRDASFFTIRQKLG